MQFPIQIGLRRSFFAMSLIMVSALLGFVVTMLTQWHGGYISVVFVLLLVAAMLALRSIGQFPQAIRVGKTGNLSLCYKDVPEPVELVLRNRPVVHPWLTVLAYRLPSGKSGTLALFPDSARKDDLRRLRVILRWQIKSGMGDV